MDRAPPRFSATAQALAVAPGRHHIVDQKNRFPAQLRIAFHHKRPGHVQAPPRIGQPSLRSRGAFTPQYVPQRNSPVLRYVAGKKLRLIEAAAPLLAPVERYGNHGVKMFVHRNGPFQICSQRTCASGFILSRYLNRCIRLRSGPSYIPKLAARSNPRRPDRQAAQTPCSSSGYALRKGVLQTAQK